MRGGNVIPARGYSGILQPQELADSVLTTLNGGAIEKQPDGSTRFTVPAGDASPNPADWVSYVVPLRDIFGAQVVGSSTRYPVFGMRIIEVVPPSLTSDVAIAMALIDSLTLATCNGGAGALRYTGSSKGHRATGVATGAATNTDTAGGATITRLMIDTEFRATNTLSHISAQGLAADDGVAVGTVAGRFPARVMAGSLYLLIGALRLATTAGPFDIDVRALATPSLIAGES